jgi:hypothetical protein
MAAISRSFSSFLEAMRIWRSAERASLENSPRDQIACNGAQKIRNPSNQALFRNRCTLMIADKGLWHRRGLADPDRRQRHLYDEYAGAPGVDHDPHLIGKMAAKIVLPSVHRVFSNVKAWALGVYHGLRKKHLQSYSTSSFFGFNRRADRRAAFRSLLAIGIANKPITYNMLIPPEVAG